VLEALEAMQCPPRVFAEEVPSREVHVITKEMTITQILRRYPETLPIFERYGLDCNDCQIAEFEQLEHGATVHKVDIDTLIIELNRHTIS
jgi:hybrid cluster-associated redox disulfide protein